jgi:hypothetical protein
MTEKLSERFYGNKLFRQEHYEAVREGPPHPSVLKDAFGKMFAKYSSINPDLEELLLDFHTLNVEFAQSQSFPFQKFTTFLELAARVFEWSFDEHKNREESF